MRHTIIGKALLAAVLGVGALAPISHARDQDRLVLTDAQLEDDPVQVVLKVQGRLTAGDARDRLRRGSFAKVFTVRLSAQKAYAIELASRRGQGFFDTFVRIEDERGRVLAENDDEGPDTRNSFLEFQPQRTGIYRVVVTSFQPNATGLFQLLVSELPADDLPPDLPPDVVIPPGRTEPLEEAPVVPPPELDRR